jgi:hypothetical protein
MLIIKLMAVKEVMEVMAERVVVHRLMEFFQVVEVVVLIQHTRVGQMALGVRVQMVK